jgi:asparagine synthase (glutamine-hydrolysing)
MCGIAGYLKRQSSPDAAPNIVRRMTEAIRHRGPDADGFFEDSHCSLGHRRLSIIDPAAGQQPMFNEDGRFAIVFNGEIYNHADLAATLRDAGHIYRSHCDTETILHGFEQWGPDSLMRLRGMFAFAIWDRARKELFCARDRLGIKPFYYYLDHEVFVFASEIKAVLEHPAVSARLEKTVLPEYLAFGYGSDERTLFRGIRKLMPGCFVRIRVDRFEAAVAPYWSLPVTPSPRRQSDSEWIHETRARLEQAVESHLMSDVPLGMFLSGGLDSSAVAAIMQRKISEPAKTFAVGYSEQQYSELSWARTVAAAIGTDHHEVTVNREEFFSALPTLIWHEDEPITWPSSASLYFVSRLAARHVKVVLTGEGSDECFAGYGRYRYQLLNQRAWSFYRHMPEALRKAVRGQIAQSPLLSADLRRKLNHTVLGRTGDLESLYLANFYGAFSREEQAQLLGPNNGGAYTNFHRFYDEAAALNPLERMLYADKKTYLVELLMKQDRMSMAASIESRVPFLDHEFVEFTSAIPAHLKLHGSAAKYVLKEAVADLLPRRIVHRAKMGFPTPLKAWLLDPASAPLYALLEEPEGLIAQELDRSMVSALIRRHREGREDATDRIWTLLNIQIWGDIFITGKRDRWLSGKREPEMVPARTA